MSAIDRIASFVVRRPYVVIATCVLLSIAATASAMLLINLLPDFFSGIHPQDTSAAREATALKLLIEEAELSLISYPASPANPPPAAPPPVHPPPAILQTPPVQPSPSIPPNPPQPPLTPPQPPLTPPPPPMSPSTIKSYSIEDSSTALVCAGAYGLSDCATVAINGTAVLQPSPTAADSEIWMYGIQARTEEDAVLSIGLGFIGGVTAVLGEGAHIYAVPPSGSSHVATMSWNPFTGGFHGGFQSSGASPAISPGSSFTFESAQAYLYSIVSFEGYGVFGGVIPDSGSAPIIFGTPTVVQGSLGHGFGTSTPMDLTVSVGFARCPRVSRDLGRCLPSRRT